MIFTNCRVILADAIRDDLAVVVRDGKIAELRATAPQSDGTIDLGGNFLAPGFVDVHVHGGNGHFNAWEEEASAALENGMRSVTHTFNCMSSARRRGTKRVAGLLEFALSEAKICCELIAEEHHVSPALMKLAYCAKGVGGIA